MAYSKKAPKTVGKSNADFKGFNAHLLEVLGEDPEQRIGVISGIVELGVQQRANYEEKYTGSEKQDAKLEYDNTYLSEDETMIITEQSPAEQVAFFIDFPELEVNYGKYFSESKEDDIKPFRYLLQGDWWDSTAKEMIAKGVALTTVSDPKNKGKRIFSPLSTVSKLALFSKVVPKAPVPSDFDLGELLGEYVAMDIYAEKSKDYINIKHAGLGSKHPKLPVPDYDLEPFGISFDGDNSTEDLKQVRNSQWNAIKRAENWEGSGLKAEYDEMQAEYASKAKKDNEESGEEEEDKKPKAKPKAKKPQKASAKKKPDPEPEEDDDGGDECPFD